MIVLAVIIITIAGALLRLAQLRQPLTYDEVYNYVWFVHGGFLNAISNYHVPNNHILQTLLSWASVSVFGFSLPVFRLPALIAGVLCIPATYRVGSRLYNPGTGLLAAAALVMSDSAIFYATQARGYSLQWLFVLMLVDQAIRLKTRGVTLGAWRGYILGALGALWVLPSSISAIAAIAGWLLVSSRWKRQTLFAHLYIGAFTIVLYAPVVKATGLDALVANRFVTPLAPDVFPIALLSVLQEWGQLVMGNLPPVLALTCMGGALVALGGLAWSRVSSDWLIPLLGTTAIVFVVLQRNPGFARTWLYLMPFTFILGMAGLLRLRPLISKRPTAASTSRTAAPPRPRPAP